VRGGTRPDRPSAENPRQAGNEQAHQHKRSSQPEARPNGAWEVSVDARALDLLSGGAEAGLVREQVSGLRCEHPEADHDPRTPDRHGSR
jgi:hypothetical protein